MSDDKKRLKDLDADSKAKYETLSPNMKAFVLEYEEKRGKVFKITSGKRDAEDKVGKNHEHSKHNTGDALDFSATNIDDYNFLVNTKDGLALMHKYGLGVLDETDPEMMKKTKATGAHFHVGTDPGLVQKTKERFETFDTGVEPILSYKQRYESGEDPKQIAPELNNVIPYEQKQYQDIFNRVAEKEIIKEVKTEKSEDRKELQKETTQQEEFMKEYFKETQKQKPQTPEQQMPERQAIDLNFQAQNQLPELPNIFNVPEMAEGGVVTNGNTTVYTDKEGNKTTKVAKEDGTVYIKVVKPNGQEFNKIVPAMSPMPYKQSEDYKQGIQYPQIISQSDNTSTAKPYIQTVQPKQVLASRNEQKALAQHLVETGGASRYLGDNYNGTKTLNEAMLEKIQQNPNIMETINKQEYQYLIDKEQKAYDKASPFEKTASFIHSAITDPVLVGSNLLEGKAPMLWQGVNLRDNTNPETQRFYNQNSGAGSNIVNTVFNTINPGNIGANASQHAREGDYLGVAMDVAELIGLGAGAINPVNYAGAINKAEDAIKNTSKYITEQTILKDTYKINPFVFTPKKEAYYRQVFGDLSTEDYLVTKSMRENQDLTGLNAYINLQEVPANSGGINYTAHRAQSREFLPYFYKGRPYYPDWISQGKKEKGLEEILLETKKVNGEYPTDFKDFFPASTQYVALDESIPEEVLQSYFENRVLSPFSGRDYWNNLENYNIYKRNWLKGYKKVN